MKTIKESFTTTSKISLVVLMTLTLGWSSCIIVEDESNYYGPHGVDGKAWFGIDYDYQALYSYWDDNPNFPENPFYGEYYRTNPGLYNFEYFVNPYEYWYGTYEIFINPGMSGGPHGQPGMDGNDTYLLMICNPDGFYYDEWEDCSCQGHQLPDGSWIIEGNANDQSFKITMKKTNVTERPVSHTPKLKNS